MIKPSLRDFEHVLISMSSTLGRANEEDLVAAGSGLAVTHCHCQERCAS